ncbi:unnamed protein product [Ilex paraguariensis]|uniref:Major facilitator superfamily (MFS) profile domain-containing protein n=1 Tax=Ilex paraguariensis TaxID=185542 RepID=A0ABC8QPF1_9AQUA
MEKLAGLSHLFVTVFLSNFAVLMVNPAITDVTMAALCPGKDQCSLAIYLSGLQQAIIGMGTLVMIPLIGKLSDVYGRKALLTLPMTLSILPLVILAYSRSTTYFYVYYVFRTLTAMTSEGSVQCLALAYVADNISEGKRVSAIGVLTGVGTAAIVCGTLATRFLSTAQTFQVAAFVAMAAVVYMRLFLKDTNRINDALVQPMLKSGSDVTKSDEESSKKIQVFKRISSMGELICLLSSSGTFSRAAFVAFFNSLAEGGLHASLLYFFKAQFHFNKDQFADLMLIVNIGGTFSQLLLMPTFAPIIGEEKLLSIGLFAGFLNMLLNSIAWSVWVPYAVAGFYVFTSVATPSLRSIVSKQVGPMEQGMAQGCISGVSSFANIISPLIYSPLAALFLSDRAPFHFPGFSVMCIGLAWMMAFIASTMIKAAPHSSRGKISIKDYTVA